MLLAGIGGLAWYGLALPALTQVILWGLLGLTAAVLLRRGWLKLFGPVLFYDMICIARRGRYFGLRCLYAGLLLFFLFTVYLNTRNYGLTTAQEASRLGETYFQTFMLVQFIAVLLLTPAYVAGAVADEKVRRTLEFLLATDLRNREIVLSKLMARVANLTLFVLTGLPILSLIQFLGGVDPNLVLAGFAATGLTVAGLAGFSILNSVSFKRPRDAITIAYLGAITYLLLSLLLETVRRSGWGIMATPLWFGSSPPTLGDAAAVFNSGNIFVLLPDLAMAGMMGTLASVVPVLLGKYALFHGVVFTVCTVWSVLRLRRVALRQLYGRTRKAYAGRVLLGRPAVGDHPMLWKELFIEGGVRFNLLGSVIVILLLIGTLLPGLWIMIQWWIDPQTRLNPWWDISRDMNVYVRFAGTGAACLLLLAVAVRASNSISSERDRQTFDGLLTTPLDSTAILWAKWVGSILSIRLGWIWLGLIWGMGVVTGGLHIFALPLVALSWMVYAGVAAMLGLWFSMVSRSSMRATVWTLFSGLGITLGHWLLWLLCIPIMMRGSGRGFEEIAKFQAGITPPAVLGILSFSSHEFRNDWNRKEFTELVFFCLFGLVLYTVAGLGFWYGALNPRFRNLTGRQDFRTPEGRPPRSVRRPRPQLLEPISLQPAKPPPTALPQNVILLEESWDPPKRAPDEEEPRPG